MKNIICFFTLILCVMVSSVNAQNATSNAVVSNSTSIVLSQGFSKVPSIIEDIDTKDAEVRNIAMMQEEISPEATPVVTVVLNQGFPKVASIMEDIDTEDAEVRNIAMMQEEISPEAADTDMAGNYIVGEKTVAKY